MQSRKSKVESPNRRATAWHALGNAAIIALFSGATLWHCCGCAVVRRVLDSTFGTQRVVVEVRTEDGKARGNEATSDEAGAAEAAPE